MSREIKGSLAEFGHNAYLCASSCLNCTLTFPGMFDSCPMLKRHQFMAYSSKGMSGLIQGYLAGVVEADQDFAKIIYSCALCGACREGCQQKWSDYNLEVFEAMREEIVELGMAPPVVRDYFKNMITFGNPFGEPQKERASWSAGLGVPEYDGHEFLLYVGDVGSYDEKGKESARAASSVLAKAGVSFGILHAAESSDGNEVNRMGERGLFEHFATQNIEKFKELKVEKVITLSPHAYNTFKNDYSKIGGDFFEVWHYTQVLASLIKQGSVKMTGSLDRRVVFHDPCFLGRRNGEYDAPRDVLAAIQGAEVISLPLEKELSFCCGGGGGNFATDLLGGGGSKDPNRQRVRQLVDTGADVIAVACPTCALMLENGLRDEGLEGRIVVSDVARVLDAVC